jgi:hypothetical protein
MLLYMKSLTEGIRGLVYFTGYCADRVRTTDNEADRSKWQGFLDLLTPVVKAYSTDMGFRVTETAMQVYGGYGYIREYPMEQFLRDQKITSIYEGTNGIQALDLVARKLGMGKGMVFMSLLGEVSGFIQSVKGHPVLGTEIDRLEVSKNAVAEVAMFFASKAKEDFTLPVLYACPFLDLFGDMLVGWQLLWQAAVAQEKLQQLLQDRGVEGTEAQSTFVEENRDAAYYTGKIASARFFANTFLTLAPAKAQVIKNGDKSPLEIPEIAFASA